MQSLQFSGNIRVIRIEDGITFSLPPKPILHNRIEWDVLFSIAMSYLKNLVLRHITVLRLEQTIRPFWKHGRVPGQAAIFVDDLVHFRPIDQVVVDRFASQ